MISYLSIFWRIFFGLDENHTIFPGNLFKGNFVTLLMLVGLGFNQLPNLDYQIQVLLPSQQLSVYKEFSSKMNFTSTRQESIFQISAKFRHNYTSRFRHANFSMHISSIGTCQNVKLFTGQKNYLSLKPTLMSSCFN